ncbi:MAG: Hsp20/alpha crystallin family protein [Halobacteriovoraceae bacterium]|jgi:HSP20 family protein|nr:Hsp20/alpha crystallin family protein [Halobacteriovoraceae bacterium]
MRYAVNPISTRWTDLDRTFDHLTRSFFGDSPNKSENENLPRVEVYENEDYYALSFDVPGFLKEDLKIDLEEDRLIVTGERRQVRNEDNSHSFYSEKSYGTFTRTITLPRDVAHEEIEAELKNGVLNLKVKKEPSKLKRTVEIKEIAS